MASNENPENYEQEHVHTVYEQIADHFSSTRYKPWPIISSYLTSLPPGSLGLDVGCGNGKNLNVNPSIYMIGSDRSESLVRIASTNQKTEVVIADILDMPHPPRTFDFAICIAVVHHLSSHERRVEAIKSVLDVLKPGTTGREGTGLFYVWALEQKDSRRGWDENSEQDVMVPWVKKSNKTENGASEKVYQRYYHLYREGELEESIVQAGGSVVESGYEKDNWWAIARQSKP